LAAATTYTYIVQAYNSGGSANSGTASAATLTPPPPTAPGAPTLTVVSSSEIDLAWSGGSGQTSFNILRCTGTCTPTTVIGSVAANVFSYKNTGLAASTTYSYAVQAVNAGGTANSATSTAATQAPPALSAPSNLRASAVRTGKKRKVSLSWANGSNPGANNDIERCTGSSCTSFSQIGQVSGTTTSYQDSSVSAGTTYNYRVRAQSGTSFSGYSNIATVTP
ncbi:MAG TPA: fibronectin type III domain-containing protein, partial [Bryobacterales bacterium]|nr:fibronectin type III domain-containing protein [Bryobacterales bacterium]